MINILIFSKNRGCQLDLLLESMMKHAPLLYKQAVVLYTFSEGFESGYTRAKELHPSVRFIVETSFRDDVLNEIASHTDRTVFFVDDDVFIRDLPDENSLLLSEDSLLCISLRMWPGIDYCYSQDLPSPRPPSFDAKSNSWLWLGAPGDWGYPCSLDGHIFRSDWIREYLAQLAFHNPNSMEGQMAMYAPTHINRMSCLPEPVIVNNPMNIVQVNNPNRFGDVSAGQLQIEFMEGKRLNPDAYENVLPNAPHIELEPVFYVK